MNNVAIGCHEGLIVMASIIDGICWIIADVPCAFYCRVKALKMSSGSKVTPGIWKFLLRGRVS